MEIVLRPFVAGDEEQVVSLISGIQREEFGMGIRPEDQPDLFDISGVYQRGNGNFWVAFEGRRLVGAVALLDIGEGLGALRKMFVAGDMRGDCRVASSLLAILLSFARRREVRVVYLGTAPHFCAAHRFYEKNGFTEVGRASLPPSFPIMDVDSKFYRIEP